MVQENGLGVADLKVTPLELSMSTLCLFSLSAPVAFGSSFVADLDSALYTAAIAGYCAIINPGLWCLKCWIASCAARMEMEKKISSQLQPHVARRQGFVPLGLQIDHTNASQALAKDGA